MRPMVALQCARLKHQTQHKRLFEIEILMRTATSFCDIVRPGRRGSPVHSDLRGSVGAYSALFITYVALFAFASAGQADSFIYSNGVFTRVTIPGAANSDVSVSDINNSGEIVGTDFDRGFLQSNGVTTLFPLDTEASGISNNGVVVGLAGYLGNGLVYKNGVFSQFDYPGTGGTALTDINNQGEMVGIFSNITTGHSIWFLYNNGIFTPVVPPGNPTFGLGINDLGQIVGAYTPSSGGYSGFIDTNGVFKTITVPGSTGTVAEGINDLGEVVGWYWDIHGVTHGFLYDNDTFTTIDAPAQSSPIEDYATRLFGINDLGQIVGSSSYYFLPTPEPGSIFLVLSGLSGAGLLFAKKNKGKQQG